MRINSDAREARRPWSRLFKNAGRGAACCALVLEMMATAPGSSAQENKAPTPPAPPRPIELEADRKTSTVTGGTCFLKGGTVITVTRGIIPNGSVLVRNGKIAQIGPNLTPPAGVPVIDATGKFITPGIVDAHSHIAEDGTNEGSDSITAEVRITDVLDPQSLTLQRGLSNGVTASLLLHGSANPIGGQSVVIKMKWQHPAEELIVPDAPRMIKFALGENVIRSGGQSDSPRFPATRMGVEAVYRRAFAEAREYMAEWERYDHERANNPKALPPRRDLRLETLADILRGKIWVQCHCYRADEMLMMVRLSQQYGFKIGALQHALEAYKIAPELVAAHIPVSTFADSWAYKLEAFDAIPYNAALCERAGIITSVNSDNTAGTYRLNLEAAKCIKYGGLSPEEAWKLITINPAMQLGIDRRTGSLEVGKDADIALWEGDPLSVYSKCVMTLVEGEVYFQRRDAFGVDKSATIRQELASCSTDHLAFPHLADGHVYAIVGATLHPINAPDIVNGTLIIEDGRIKAIGNALTVPKGAIILSAKGLHVYPGLIDAGSQLGLTEIGEVASSADYSEGGAFQPDLQALTAVNPASEHYAITRNEGITATLTHPGSSRGFGGGGSLIVGQGAVINLCGWTPELMKVKSDAALHVTFPEGGRLPRAFRAAAPADFLQRQRDQLREQTRRLKDYFDRAKRYAAAKTSGSMPVDPQMEAMLPYVTDRLPVVFTVNSLSGIRQMIAFADQEGLKPIIAGGAEAWVVADMLAQKHIPVIYSLPMENSLATSPDRNDYDPYDTLFAAPGVLQRAGVKVCFESSSAPMAKNLPTQVGITCAYGMDHTAALRALTADAAEILGVSDQMGSLEAGKLANVIVTDGDPMEITTHLHALFIAGKPCPLESKHTRLYQTYLQRLPALTPAKNGAKAQHTALH